MIIRLKGADKEAVMRVRDELSKPEFTIICDSDLELFDCSELRVEVKEE